MKVCDIIKLTGENRKVVLVDQYQRTGEMKFENIPDRCEEPVAWTETQDHKMTDSAVEVETQQRNACINKETAITV